MSDAGHTGRRMDKRIAGIIRWLEHCRSSYQSGAIESALMDAECARADLEDLRLDVWERVGDRYAPKRSRRGSTLRTLLLLPILMVMATPSRIEPRVTKPRLEADAVTVTVPGTGANVVNNRDRDHDLDFNLNLADRERERKREGENAGAPVENVRANADAQAGTTSAVSKKSRAKNPSANAFAARPPRSEPKSEPKPEQKSRPAKQEIPTYDTMLALFQTGQRALRQ